MRPVDLQQVDAVLGPGQALVTADDALTPAEHAAGWTVLFDGSSTAAWRGYRRAGFPESGWIIDDGWWPLFHPLGAGDLPRGYQHPPGTGLYLFGDQLARIYMPRREVVDVMPLRGVKVP